MKAADNHHIGREKMLTGDVHVFPTRDSWPKTWASDAHLAGLCSNMSEQMVYEKVITPLVDLGKSTYIQGWFAHIDSPLHATILSGDTSTEKALPPQTKNIYDLIAKDPEVIFIRTLLQNLTATFDFVCNNGDNITLNCTHIPSEILIARTRMASVYRRFGLRVHTIEDFFHMTVMRIRTLPEVNTHASLTTFVERVDALHEKILQDPSVVTFDTIWFGYDMQRKTRTELLSQ